MLYCCIWLPQRIRSLRGVALAFCKGISENEKVCALQKASVTVQKCSTGAFLSLRSTHPRVDNAKIKKPHQVAFYFGGSLRGVALAFCKGISGKEKVCALQKASVIVQKCSTGAFLSLRSTRPREDNAKTKKPHQVAFLFWWSRGESNPCPKIYSHIFLRVHFVYLFSAYQR